MPTPSPETTMHTVKGKNGGQKRVTRLVLEQLRMLMDWQLRELGYDPQSVTEACRRADTSDNTQDEE